MFAFVFPAVDGDNLRKLHGATVQLRMEAYLLCFHNIKKIDMRAFETNKNIHSNMPHH